MLSTGHYRLDAWRRTPGPQDFILPFRCRDRGARARVVGLRATLNGSFLREKLLQLMQGEPALRHENPQLHSRLHVWQEGRSGFRLWRSRAATFGYPVSTYFGAGRHFADSSSDF